MTALSNHTSVSFIPVIILGARGSLPKVLYLDTQLSQRSRRNGETLMHEIKEHIPDTKLTRFTKRCSFQHQIVSVAKLINTSNGLQLTTPIPDILLTRALKKPIILGAVPAAEMVNTDEVLVIEWQANEETRALAAKLARVIVRVGVLAFSILNLVGV